LPKIWASEGKLAQVFLNLLINAAHAIDEGDADNNRITLRTWVEGEDVLAEVKDTGKGIPPENLERIFDPFFSTKGPGKGSGLGLAICRSIVAEFEGTIRVESQMGKGTRFVLRFPVKPDELEERCVTGAPGKPQPVTVRGRILVVDDEEVLRRTMQRLLGAEHDVSLAASGAEARSLLERDSSFDLILCDLMMPEMTGMDLHVWLLSTIQRSPGRWCSSLAARSRPRSRSS
jgi:anti-sigma regulatory factor (Ser/Thr protein kinase)